MQRPYFPRMPAPTQTARPGEALDLGTLQTFLREALPSAPPLRHVRQFERGFSNLTYLLELGGGDAGEAGTPQRLVLRRPPFGPRSGKAHDMLREHRVLTGLQQLFPATDGRPGLAPVPLAVCGDAAVLGAPFYLMSFVDGEIVRQPGGPVLAKADARTASEALARALARLHDADLADSPLVALGRPEGYVERQIEGWIGRYERARTPDVAELGALSDYLRAERPADGPATLVHNDYKFDNVVFAPRDYTRVAAVLDWEMCTVGDPLMDLGLTLAYWAHAEEVAEMPFLGVNGTHLPGMMRREELAAVYAAARGEATGPAGAVTGVGLGGLTYYFVFGNVKIAGIVQQIYARYVGGHTRDPRFKNLGHVVNYLLRRAARVL